MTFLLLNNYEKHVLTCDKMSFNVILLPQDLHLYSCFDFCKLIKITKYYIFVLIKDKNKSMIVFFSIESSS